MTGFIKYATALHKTARPVTQIKKIPPFGTSKKWGYWHASIKKLLENLFRSFATIRANFKLCLRPIVMPYLPHFGLFRINLSHDNLELDFVSYLLELIAGMGSKRAGYFYSRHENLLLLLQLQNQLHSPPALLTSELPE